MAFYSDLRTSPKLQALRCLYGYFAHDIYPQSKCLFWDARVFLPLSCSFIVVKLFIELQCSNTCTAQ